MKNKIRSLIFCSAILGFGTVHAAYVNVNDATKNSSMAKALNLDASFDTTFDANIGSPAKNISKSFFHASPNATTGKSGSKDWYSFTTYQAKVQAHFDIDNTKKSLDSWLNLYDSKGKLLSFNDDGGVKDLGSVNGYDSFLSAVLSDPGLYFLSVGRYPDLSLIRGQDYTLHVSLKNHTVSPVVTPNPAAIWLFGSGIAGLISLRRKNLHVSPVVFS